MTLGNSETSAAKTGKCERMFPIMHGGPVTGIPWRVIAPHEKQAVKNHGQSLNRLAERGGLSPGEAWCVLNDIDLRFKLEWNAVEKDGEKLIQQINRGGGD